MALTGEKYTEARRALMSSEGGGGGADAGPGVAVSWPEDSLGWFSDQAYNAILLAEDEARMLSHATVESEHLLLAAARGGRVQELLAGEGVEAHAIHALILRLRGFGPKLELRPCRSPASEQVLRGAIVAASDRGVLGPSTPHLLLALAEEEMPRQILGELGVRDVQALVDARYPVTHPPVDRGRIELRAAQLAARGTTPPSPGPIPPVFERFTSAARDAINSGIEHARKLNDGYVEPLHLLLGVLEATVGLVARIRMHYGWDSQLTRLVQPRYPQINQQLWTDIFSREARRILAEDVLILAERMDHRAISTGHLLIASLECPDERTPAITATLPDVRELAEAVIDLLPDGEEA